MKTIIAKTIIGKEFIYSKLECYQVSKASAAIIEKALNDNKYHLKNNEIWKVYTVSEFDLKGIAAEGQKIFKYKNKLKFYEVWKIAW